ncbi:MAG TPA: tRNA uridine-5-carboxymethylaminomethyl(34) synthesis GTPase MnmE [Kofleriaceae bacterium]|nr:tRNA uridine-5-carboxymethylaminomethyl(34) synthesis GTPase MnmE [Kofleriaceae bacterium]
MTAPAKHDAEARTGTAEPAEETEEDTIAAIATAAGPGGVGIVRLSGPRAIAIAEDTVGVPAGTLDRRVRVRWARDARGARVDQVVAFAMRAPASFTGEDTAELQGHGGAMNLAKLLEAVLARGARVAEPGEFTRRAVGNGKLDLVRAEALLEVIHAGSERAWRLAQENLGGRLGEGVAALEARGLRLLAELEGWIDFPEEDLETQSLAWIEAELGALHGSCAALADGFRHGRAVSRGISAALVGPVNVGKSSLLNALVGSERAIVAAEPGTTRDWLETTAVWQGVAVTLIDTAGRRDTADPIERRGIALGEERVASADVVVVVNDGVAPWDRGERYGARAIVVRSKADLGGGGGGGGGGGEAAAEATSAATGQGLDELRRRILEVAGVADREGAEHALVTTARQHAMAAAARDAFAAGLALWRARRPLEVLAVELRQGAQALAQLRGVEVGERVLDEVFARFCIGK